MRRLQRAALACATGLLLLMNPTAALADGAVSITPFSEARAGKLPAPWRSVGLPGSSKPLTRFDLVPVDGLTVLRVLADHSYANLVHDLPDVVLPRGTQLRWRWRLEQALPDADLRHRETDDTALKVCLLFNAPAENLGALEQSLLGVARALSGENLPAATLCYVWDTTLPVGTVLNNVFTARIRMMVVDSGSKAAGPLGQPPAGRGGGLRPRVRARIPHAAAAGGCRGRRRRRQHRRPQCGLRGGCHTLAMTALTGLKHLVLLGLGHAHVQVLHV